MMKDNAARGTIPFLLGSALLGTIGIFLHEAHADPVTATWFRCAFGLLGLTAWVLARRQGRHLLLSAATAPWVLSAATLMVAAWALFFFAIGLTTTGVAVVLFHIQPLWVLILGAWWFGETIGGRRLGAVLVAMAGLLLATGVAEQATLFGEGQALPPGYWLGIAACLAGALMTAIVTLIAKRMGSLPSGILAWWQCAIGTVLLLAWPVAQGWPQWGESWAWLAGLGLIHTGLAYTLTYAGLPHLSTGRIAILQFVYPAVAVVMDWLFLGETLSGIQMTGIVILSAAVWFAERGHQGAAAASDAGRSRAVIPRVPPAAPSSGPSRNMSAPP